MYRSVLITGAGGFIGSHLVRHQLSLGRRVRALDITRSKSEELSQNGAELVAGDITDPSVQEKAVHGIDLVFHLASAHLAVNVPEDTYWKVNVHCLRGLLERCRQAGVQRLVHVSSVGVYGNVQDPPADETHPCRPDLLYERTKYEGEKQVGRFFEETGFPVVIVRPAWVYGPGCPRTYKLFRSIQKKRFFLVGNGNTLRHCIYIDDLLAGLELCGREAAAVGKVYIIADNTPVMLAELVQQIAKVLDVPSPRFHVPVWLMGSVGALLEVGFYPLGKEPPFSRRTLKFFTNNGAFDISRARQELGFRPEFDLSDGLRSYASWFISRQSLWRKP
jgi:nucleoside-diphosphate-sugar epimerase